MINFHPENALLAAYAADTLPLSMTLAVAIHIEFCPACAKRVADLESQLAANMLLADNAFPINETHLFDDMLSFILQQPEAAVPTLTEEPKIELQGKTFWLPRALRHISRQSWQKMGNVSRSRILLDEQSTERASLMYLAAGAAVPTHTHRGTELTLPITGVFRDELGEYIPGDFILRDANIAHQPQSQDGCLCFALLDAPVQFTQGLPRLLNGFGDLLY
jgi:putative transcriptional regulator